ncbi:MULTISPECIES: MarR family winged helix-turn-helix transcriptional regulator [Enterobacteriaceae]|uniref:MarR family winged helix-turn-helix transcriptional regulator n=1 Tax=Enterobacteriaceae TaxID=543 RepID=UPI0009808CBC|nr:MULTISPECIES: MarR family winged helix-turn-helix transcriptional regulator [Enterobacteriaceae]MCW4948693.1 MarR family winged helix-turn-helix transcriptional regulator [Enterobacter hormaechei subsp. xiangfangensis]OOB84834.1 MarR family transcriptional regulator [Leclercia adecarboxylata]HAW0699219.1 winged helix-turn-helix transcriptional regulator [Escherichia coli]
MSENTMPRLGMELSFALYSAAGRMVRMHKPLLDPLALTFPQYLVLLELYAGTPRNVGELGNSLAMDTGTITPLLKRMEKAGLLTRTRDPLDERRILVGLTAKAETIREDVWAVSGKIKARCQLDEAGLVALRDTLRDFAHLAED